MKKYVCALLICALIFGIGGCGGNGGEVSPTSPAETPQPTEALPEEAAGNDPIIFADAAFESSVREALGIAEGDITAAEAAAVTELNLQMPGNDWSIPRIADLSDLKYFPNLIYLDLSWALAGDGGVDLGPIAGLTGLEYLAIACTNVQGIEPLAALTHLKNLQCWGLWSITDVSPLAGLAELESLWISDNLISDISPLAGLANLSSLVIENNMVSDVSPLAGLYNLRSLMLAGNPVKDYTP
ncbi:MAG: leucine-rich repeat domain-containing protein, partial [Clostridia bacterium]|nr:leucine-rich repeat domain-containing protein [Clostridia bacterium]